MFVCTWDIIKVYFNYILEKNIFNLSQMIAEKKIYGLYFLVNIFLKADIV